MGDLFIDIRGDSAIVSDLDGHVLYEAHTPTERDRREAAYKIARRFDLPREWREAMQKVLKYSPVASCYVAADKCARR